mgnify:CR=1 FL=1
MWERKVLVVYKMFNVWFEARYHRLESASKSSIESCMKNNNSMVLLCMSRVCMLA